MDCDTVMAKAIAAGKSEADAKKKYDFCMEKVALLKRLGDKVAKGIKHADKRDTAATKLQSLMRGKLARLRANKIVKKVKKGDRSVIQDVDRYLVSANKKLNKAKKKLKGCSGRKKSTCGRTRSSAHCKWKKSKGCVKKPSGKTYVRSSSGSKKSARKVRCSGKRKGRCNNMKSCRWNKKKSRCRASRARFNSFDESEQLFAPTVNLP